MTREQVIKGLECCASDIICRNECPYYSECTDDQQALMKDALALIKAQQEELIQLRRTNLQLKEWASDFTEVEDGQD